MKGFTWRDIQRDQLLEFFRKLSDIVGADTEHLMYEFLTCCELRAAHLPFEFPLRCVVFGHPATIDCLVVRNEDHQIGFQLWSWFWRKGPQVHHLQIACGPDGRLVVENEAVMGRIAGEGLARAARQGHQPLMKCAPFCSLRSPCTFGPPNAL